MAKCRCSTDNLEFAMDKFIMIPIESLFSCRCPLAGMSFYPCIESRAMARASRQSRIPRFLRTATTIDHSVMETFQVMNGLELTADVDETKHSVPLSRQELLDWVATHQWHLRA